MMNLLRCVAVGVASLGPLAAYSAPTVFFKPAPTATVVSGGSVQIGVWISGLTAASEIVSAFNLNVHLSNSILGVGSATYSPGAPLGSLLGALPDAEFSSTATASDVSVLANSFLSNGDLETLQTGLGGVANEFLLYTLAFTAANVNASTLLTFASRPAFDMNVVGKDPFSSLVVNFGSTCVIVGNGGTCQQVPEPASYGLAAIALFAAGVAGRSRRRLKTLVAAA